MSRKLGTTAQEALARNPGKALAAIRRLRQDLDELEEAQVGNALSRGWSWARIGRALGVSRQAVHRKYGSCSPSPLPRSQPTFAGNLRMAVAVARTEAAARGDALVGTEHLLLGLLQQGEGSAAAALRAAGASLRVLRAAVDVLAPSDVCNMSPSQIGFTTRANAALEEATRLAARERTQRVTEQHLLRALLRADDSGAVATLTATGVPVERVEIALNRAAGGGKAGRRPRRRSRAKAAA